ncbi:MAG: Purine catabolism protein PucG [Chloroflexi bacterium ADurb.Bin325]|nr:MAG: Purine catabolism protein PucG [Chloroflexi bacterium ADurb.Bin325]
MPQTQSYYDLDLPARLLLGPGPSMVHPRVLRAMATPLVGYLDPSYLAVMDETQELLRMVFQTQNPLTLALPGTGSAGMEAALYNFIEEGDPVLICVAGYFGERMVEMAARARADVRRIDAPWGQVISERQVAQALDERPAKLVAIVHGETSTGIAQPLHGIAEVVHRHGALLVVDTVASLGGVSVPVDEIGIDICYTGSQKCLSAPPGLAPITVGPRAEAALAARTTRVQSWYLDLTLQRKYWNAERVYHHTGPASMMFALREALRLVAEEGLTARFERHARVSRLLWEGLEARGLSMLVPPEYRLASLTTVRVPAGADEAGLRGRLLAEYGVDIAGALGALKGRYWRVGLMGHSCRPENVVTLLGALDRVLAG